MPTVHPLFDPETYTLTYVVYDDATRDAVVIDPVLDYEPATAKISMKSVDTLLAFVAEKRLTVHHVLETHAHADHLSSSQVLKERLGAKIAIGARISEVQSTFKPVFGNEALATDGSQFDVLLRDGETLRAGSLGVRILSTPGHTPACLSFLVGDALFTGDALFIEDYGTGRCDFPRGSAEDLYHSVHDVLYALPDTTRVFVGHDYQPNGRALRFETTIAAEKKANIQLRADTPKSAFVDLRQTRDAKLAAPRLLLPSVQVNIDAGRLPAPNVNGKTYLVLPVGVPEGAKAVLAPR